MTVPSVTLSPSLPAGLMRGEVPPLVAIQGALHLAERYATPGSARFVNGILDTIARRLGRL